MESLPMGSRPGIVSATHSLALDGSRVSGQALQSKAPTTARPSRDCPRDMPARTVLISFLPKSDMVRKDAPKSDQPGSGEQGLAGSPSCRPWCADERARATSRPRVPGEGTTRWGPVHAGDPAKDVPHLAWWRRSRVPAPVAGRVVLRPCVTCSTRSPVSTRQWRRGRD